MNEIHSPNEQYYTRWLTPQLVDAVDVHPVVVLTGARQVGKSTLLRHAEPFSRWRYHTLDNYDTLAQAKSDPTSLWAGTTEVVIDEVQRLPELLLDIKQAVDQQPLRHRFALSGSANLLLLRHVSESLAGRAGYFVLNPMTRGEQNRIAPPSFLDQILAGHWPDEAQLPLPPSPTPLLLRGFMPRLLSMTEPSSWVRWWEGYIRTYLERDLRQISQIDSLIDFRRLMEILALRTGQVLNQSDVGRDAGLTQPTARRYINLLETTYLFERLPSFAAGRGKRLVKSPKVFWTDPGLPVFLSGYFDLESLERARELGSFLETMIYQHLRVWAELQTPRARIYYWRTHSGQEVDFVIEQGRKLLGVEVKMATSVKYEHTRGLQAFLDAHPQALGGLVIYCGDRIKRLHEQIVASPWTLVTG